MLLTVSKRLEFSASRRLFVPGWTDTENVVAFGPETQAKHGTGRNYIAYFVFTGTVDRDTGMLINISEIKERAGQIVHERFDHKFLNEDNPAFRDTVPTVENIARQLHLEVAPLFSGINAQLTASHLVESPERSATYYSDGACEGNYWFEFSAARRTCSPHLNDAENAALFGHAISIHGHNYRARLTFRSETRLDDKPLVRYDDIERGVRSLSAELDHRYLNEDVAAMKDRPTTTESLAGYIYERVNALVPLHRIRLHEREDFFAEVWNDESIFLGMRRPFHAAHRLHVRTFSDERNAALFGKCDNARGHGHRYLTEATITGPYNERTGTLYDFIAMRRAMDESINPWQDKHLDLETEEFRECPSTGENIVRALWPNMNARLSDHLVRLRLWETPNNRFTLRKLL